MGGEKNNVPITVQGVQERMLGFYLLVLIYITDTKGFFLFTIQQQLCVHLAQLWHKQVTIHEELTGKQSFTVESMEENHNVCCEMGK